MPNQIVWLVVVIGLALLAFLVGGGVLNVSKIQLGDLVKYVTGQKSELGTMKNMADSCNAWLSGAEKYSAKAIQEKYLVTEKAGPFPSLSCCSQDLRNKAIANIDGNIAADDPDFASCYSACRAVLAIKDSCSAQCPTSDQSQCLDGNIVLSTDLCSGTAAAITC